MRERGRRGEKEKKKKKRKCERKRLERKLSSPLLVRAEVDDERSVIVKRGMDRERNGREWQEGCHWFTATPLFSFEEGLSLLPE
uniref:Uncharacterized protein n=1 Tax=Nelumbo nucifera TaxID=4432 RepID=A0A822YLE9_NELNU|nr:TPA_asm: hypothetical protein HUJ06_010960 [Nelumbo nucifera]